MVRFFLILIMLIINLIIQSSTFQHIEINGIKPNTGLIITICYAMLRGDVEGSIVGFFSGFLQDVFFGKVIGLYALLGLLTGYICGKPFKDFYSDNYMLPILMTGVSTLIYETSFYIVNYFFKAKLDYFFYFYRIIFPSAVYNILLSVPIYILLYMLNRNLESSERNAKSMF